MSPRSASSRAGISRSSDVPAPEPTRTASFDLIAACPKGLLCGECGRRAARASNQELGVVHKLCLCLSRCNGQLWRHEPAAYGSLPRIMRTGSVTGAARSLNVTQPAVSAVLKHCESQLKMKLFTRVSGRLQPTAEARAIFPEIAAIFGRVEAVNSLTQDLFGGRLCTLSIAAAFPIANGYLAKAVATFIAEPPKVRVALQSLTSPPVLDRVVHPQVGIGIAYEPVVSSEVETRVLMRAGIACVMAADHPLARRKEVAVRAPEPFSIITYPPPAPFPPSIDPPLRPAGTLPHTLHPVSP